MDRDQVIARGYEILDGLADYIETQPEAQDLALTVEHAARLRACSVTINGRLLRSLGRACRSKDQYSIELHPALCQDEVALEDIVRHEAAHIVRGCLGGHGPVWVATARAFGTSYDTAGARTNLSGITYRKERRHVVLCSQCGARLTMTTRRYNVVRNPTPSYAYRHRGCGGRIVADTTTETLF